MCHLPHLGEAGVDNQGRQSISEFLAHVQVPQVVRREGLRVAEGCGHREDQVQGDRMLELRLLRCVQVLEGGRLQEEGREVVGGGRRLGLKERRVCWLVLHEGDIHSFEVKDLLDGAREDFFL